MRFDGGGAKHFNRYIYAGNSPYVNVDPNGQVLETAWDVANVAIGVTSLSVNASQGNWGAAALDGVGVLLDSIGTALPIVPAGAGSLIRAGRGADGAANAARQAMVRGRASEGRVLDELGLPKNTQKVGTGEGNAIPDALTSTRSVEIKDCASVSCTRQIRIQTDSAKASRRESVLITGEKTHVTKQTERAFDRIIRRDDLGPQ